MTHHALPAVSLRRLAAALAAPLLVVALAACSDSGSPSGDDLETGTLSIVVSGALPVRGVQLDMRHAGDLTVLDVSTTVFGGATCQENVEPGRVRAACISATDVTPPFTAWTLTVEHPMSLEPADLVTSVACTASGASGEAVAITCSLD